MKTKAIILLAVCLGATVLTAQVPQLLNYQGRVTVDGVNFDGTGQFKFAIVDAGMNQNETATATAEIGGLGDGQGPRVLAIHVTHGGSGYIDAPAVTIEDTSGSGSGAAATAIVEGGVVTSITVTANGSNYEGGGSTTVTIDPPPPDFITSASYWSNDGSSTAGSEPAAAVALTVTKGLYSVLLGDTTLMTSPLPPSVFTNPDVRLRVWFDDGINGSQLLEPDQRIAAVGYAMMGATVPDGAITSSKIATGAVGSSQMAPSSVTATHISPGAVTETKIAANAISSSKIASGAVTANVIAVGAVGSGHIADGAVGTSKLAAGAVTSNEIASGAIGSSQIAAGAVGSTQLAVGAVGSAQLAATTTAQPGHVLVANSAGELMWRPLNEIVAMQDYEFQPQAFPENIAEIDIAATGVGTISGEVIHGPGFIIDRVANAHPHNSSFDYPGLNQEMDFVFDYNGPAAEALHNWHLSGESASLTITKHQSDGQAILYTWSLQNFRLAAINPSPTGNGDRYTLVSTTGPDSLLDIQRDPPGWLTLTNRSSDFNAPKIEIEGVPVGGYPVITVNPVDKTITIQATYQTGGGLFQWARSIALGNADLKAMSLIYRFWPGSQTNEGEIGRNNFFEIFPIRYQQVSGFSPGSSPREQVVLAYAVAQNADGASATLYEPPAVEYFPAEGGTQVSRDVDRNRLHIELEGVFGTNTNNLADMPVLIQGPGFVIERHGPVDNRFSGNNKQYPFIFDLPNSSPHLTSVAVWKQAYQGGLPLSHGAKSASIIGFNNGSSPPQGSEIHRFNIFELIPYTIADLGDGYSRVVILTWRTPGMVSLIAEGNGWGNNGNQIDSALDRRVLITGVTDFYPEVTDDPEARTLTLWYNHGEGESVFNWTRLIATQGTAVHGKKNATVFAEDGVTTAKNYFGCFPIEWQLVDGVERAAKGRARVVISYDFAEDP